MTHTVTIRGRQFTLTVEPNGFITSPQFDRFRSLHMGDQGPINLPPEEALAWVCYLIEGRILDSRFKPIFWDDPTWHDDALRISKN